MRGSLKIGRLFGVEIALHASWFPIYALVIWSLAAIYVPLREPQWDQNESWLAGFAAGTLFFLSVLAHELGHGAVARRLGLQVESITLFILGGMAVINREADRARDEFWIAIAGPLASLLLGAVFALAWFAAEALGRGNGITATVCLWLAEMNVLLALFNLIPSFPMDGGRVMRGLLWGFTGDGWLATRIAAWTGRFFAYAMVLGGTYFLVSGAIASAIWLIGVGWFLNSAVSSSYRQATVRERLKGMAVGEAMNRDYPSIAPTLSLRDAADRFFQPYHVATLPVVADDGRLLGLLTRNSLGKVPESNWAFTQAGRAMVAPSQDKVLAPDEELGELVATVDGRKIEALPVVASGRLVGMLTGKRVRELLQQRRSITPRAEA